MNVFDVMIYNDDSGCEKFVSLSLTDEDFYIDTVNTTDQNLENFFVFSKFRAVSSNWPYIAYQGIEYNDKDTKQDNYVWLLNAYQPQIINRIQMPKYLV